MFETIMIIQLSKLQRTPHKHHALATMLAWIQVAGHLCLVLVVGVVVEVVVVQLSACMHDSKRAKQDRA